jgi:hypothetical protein
VRDEPCHAESAVGSDAPPADAELLVRGATGIVPQQLVGDGETVILAIKPSLWFIVLVSARWLLAGVAAVVVSEIAREQITNIWAARVQQVSLLVMAVRVLIGALQWQGRVYVLTDRRVMRLRGVLRIDLFQCALRHLQHTELTMPLSERVLGCGSVLLFTAGTDMPDAAWRTVGRPAHIYRTVLDAIEKANR